MSMIWRERLRHKKYIIMMPEVVLIETRHTMFGEARHVVMPNSILVVVRGHNHNSIASKRHRRSKQQKEKLRSISMKRNSEQLKRHRTYQGHGQP